MPRQKSLKSRINIQILHIRSDILKIDNIRVLSDKNRDYETLSFFYHCSLWTDRYCPVQIVNVFVSANGTIFESVRQLWIYGACMYIRASMSHRCEKHRRGVQRGTVGLARLIYYVLLMYRAQDRYKRTWTTMGMQMSAVLIWICVDCTKSHWIIIGI